MGRILTPVVVTNPLAPAPAGEREGRQAASRPVPSHQKKPGIPSAAPPHFRRSR